MEGSAAGNTKPGCAAGGSACKNAGSKLAGETLVPVFMPLHPAPSDTKPPNIANRAIFKFNLTA